MFTLDVVTVTGKFVIAKLEVETGDGKSARKIIDFDTMFERINGIKTSEADLRILAASRIEIDRDTFHFVSENLTEADTPLVKMHFEAVSAATEGRSAIAARLNVIRGIKTSKKTKLPKSEGGEA